MRPLNLGKAETEPPYARKFCHAIPQEEQHICKNDPSSIPRKPVWCTYKARKHTTLNLYIVLAYAVSRFCHAR